MDTGRILDGNMYIEDVSSSFYWLCVNWIYGWSTEMNVYNTPLREWTPTEVFRKCSNWMSKSIRQLILLQVNFASSSSNVFWHRQLIILGKPNTSNRYRSPCFGKICHRVRCWLMDVVLRDNFLTESFLAPQPKGRCYFRLHQGWPTELFAFKAALLEWNWV